MAATAMPMELNVTELMSGVDPMALGLAPGIELVPTGGPCGVIVRGVDLQDHVPGDVVFSLLTIFNHAGVMILRDQHRLTPERHCQIMEWFGRRFYRGATADAIDRLPMVGDLPLQLLSNRDTRKPGKQVRQDPTGAATQPLGWHSDVQDYEVPPDVTVLHGIEVPPPSAGGNTYFVNLYRAYDELGAETKAQIKHMRWRPASTYATMKGVKQPKALANDAPIDTSPVTHPVVRTHPVTGRKALWISSFTVELLGFDDPEEGKALLERLRAHLKQPHLIYTHVWRQHDVIFWDNRCVNHSRDTWDGNYLREMHRAQAGGSRPF